MKGILLIALLIALPIAGPTIADAGTGCPRVHRISLPLNKPHLKVTSRNGRLFGHLIGRSESEVVECQGEPAVKRPDAWTYNERLGPGAHSFRHSWVVKFKQGQVVEVDVIREAVGCILIPPPREWRSKP